MWPKHNILKAICIQERLKDLIAFFVMFKERDQFAVLHADIVGIQADVVPERVVFVNLFISKSKLYCFAVSLGVYYV